MNTNLINEQDLLDKLDGLINGWKMKPLNLKRQIKIMTKKK